jgi:catechol 2,3-dioxygenase-like lactoylglutathione lyase family enzyme
VQGLIFAGVASSAHADTARFLADVLDVELVTTTDVHRLTFANGSSLAFVPPDFVEGPSDTLLGFLVDDVEAAAAELRGRGAEIDDEVRSGYGFRYVHFRAPDGRRFELVEQER